MARSNAASLAAIARRVEERRKWVRALLVKHPTLTTDEIADLLDVDRSTIRRDRATIRNQERATISEETS
jgi:predicted DNA-binding transcriptional regulator YafY